MLPAISPCRMRLMASAQRLHDNFILTTSLFSTSSCVPIRSPCIHLSYHFYSDKIVLTRAFSSRKGGSNSRDGRSFQLDALPFSVSPDQAYQKFEQWAIKEQGLGPLLAVGTYPIGSASISAAYAPFWSFDLNIRFVTRNSSGRSSYTWRPEPFQSAYKNAAAPNGAIHVPGLSAYAGFSYRRSLMDPVHNTTPVFKKDDIVPFGAWMLKPLKYHADGKTLEIFPDPWNATRERAFAVIHDELSSMANTEGKSNYC